MSSGWIRDLRGRRAEYLYINTVWPCHDEGRKEERHTVQNTQSMPPSTQGLGLRSHPSSLECIMRRRASASSITTRQAEFVSTALGALGLE
jgi:hypothetical protein